MATSLSDLSAETTTRKTPLLDYHEIISTGGSLPIPDVGGLYYYPQPSRGALQSFGQWFGGLFWRPSGTPSPAYMIAISDARPDQSFRLTLESTNQVSETEVATAAQSIGKLQDALAESVRLTMKIATLEAKFAANILTNDLTVERSNLVVQLATNDAKVTNLQLEVRTNTSKPGLIVARWLVASEAGGKVGVGKVGGVSGSRQESQSGYIVLGGWRASTLYFGRDFLVYLRNMESPDLKMFEAANAGFVSYVLQSKHVSYVSGTDLQAMVGAYANINVKNYSQTLKNIDQINLAGYLAKAANLSNAGTPGEVTVEKTNITFAAWENGNIAITNRPWKEITATRNLTNNIHNRPVPLFADTNYYMGWKTVQAMVVGPAKVAKVLHSTIGDWPPLGKPIR